MSSCHHEHRDSGHSHGPPIPTNASQSLYDKIETARVSALNLTAPNDQLCKLFKSAQNKYSVRPQFKSDADCQVILKIPFTGQVKLYSIILRTNGNPENCPKSIKVFKNNENLDFDNVESSAPTLRLQHPCIGYVEDVNSESGEDVVVDDLQFVEHFVPRQSFQGCSSITVFIESNWADDEYEPVGLYSLELRGEWKPLTKDPVITLYESAANPADHKNLVQQEESQFQSAE